MHFTWKKQVKTLCPFEMQSLNFVFIDFTDKKPGKMMLSDKELEYLKELENNKEIVYLLNTRECDLISRLIKSYKEVQRQLLELQINKEID
ncbi:MAG: hypothetical protein EA393_16210 [Bacteroidetes bacterium]|nr:MAG: hypothetical protein EA393_16210 [Bacteroidota bacterium]